MLALVEFDPIVWVTLGPLRVSPHGIATALGFVAGARLLLPATRARGVDDDLVHTGRAQARARRCSQRPGWPAADRAACSEPPGSTSGWGSTGNCPRRR